jgi:hypothetical protein
MNTHSVLLLGSDASLLCLETSSPEVEDFYQGLEGLAPFSSPSQAGWHFKGKGSLLPV